MGEVLTGTALLYMNIRDVRSSDKGRLAVRTVVSLLFKPGREGSESSLPEMVNLIGPEATLKLIFAFSGMTLRVPSLQKIEDALNTVSAAMHCIHGGSLDNACSIFNVTSSAVSEVMEVVNLEYKRNADCIRKVSEVDDKDFITSITQNYDAT